MTNSKSYYIAVVSLFLIPLFIFLNKYVNNDLNFDELIPRDIYKVTLNLEFEKPGSKAYVKTFLPIENNRQNLLSKSITDSLWIINESVSNQQLVRYNHHQADRYDTNISYEVECKSVSYSISPKAGLEKAFDKDIQQYLEPEKYIQSENKEIKALADQLKQVTLLQTLQSNFAYVNNLPNSYTHLLTDALRAYKLQRASCNGKSRLLAAICRSQGIPARITGGLILEQGKKKTSHAWTEVYYQGNWIPFDPLNGHFAKIPSNYLELYKGDKYLFRHSKGLNYDYLFDIEKKYQNFTSVQSAGFNLWPLLNVIHLPLGLLRTIILLPIAALMIAIFRNVIGVKTYGILLPALIGLALINISLLSGILAFVFVIVVVSLIHTILSKWSLLHVPQMAIILTCVVLSMIALGLTGINYGMQSLELIVFLPIVIIAITAERFSKMLVEDKAEEAFKVLLNTFVLAFMTCLVFKSKMLIGIFLTYPELYLLIIFTLLVLGRWIGMRVTEYQRFSPYLSRT